MQFNRVIVVLAAFGFTLTTAVTAPEPSTATLAFRAGSTNGEFTFDTGLLKGKLRAGGKTLGLSSVIHTPTGMVLDRSMGLFSHYRVFTTGKRYGAGLWDLPSTAVLRADGAVETVVASAAGRPFQVRATYKWHDATTLDLETIVKAEADLLGFEVFLASYFDPHFTNAQVRTSDGYGSAFVAAEKAAGDWQMFVRDDRTASIVNDGRWSLPPNPVNWTICGRIARPLALRRAPGVNITAVLMSPGADCFAIATPYQTEGHYSTYLSLFGRDIKADETARARSRLAIARSLTIADIEKLYDAYDPKWAAE